MIKRQHTTADWKKEKITTTANEIWATKNNEEETKKNSKWEEEIEYEANINDNFFSICLLLWVSMPFFFSTLNLCFCWFFFIVVAAAAAAVAVVIIVWLFSSCQILVAGTFSCVCAVCCVWILFWWFKSVAMLAYVLFAEKSQELTLPERVTRDFVAKTLINGRTYNTCTDTIKVTNRRKAHSLSHFRIDFFCIISFQKYQATKNTRWKNPAAIHFQQLRDHFDVAPF